MLGVSVGLAYSPNPPTDLPSTLGKVRAGPSHSKQYFYPPSVILMFQYCLFSSKYVCFCVLCMLPGKCSSCPSLVVVDIDDDSLLLPTGIV